MEPNLGIGLKNENGTDGVSLFQTQGSSPKLGVEVVEVGVELWETVNSQLSMVSQRFHAVIRFLYEYLT